MIDRSRILTTGAHGIVGSYIDFGIRTDAQELNILDREATKRFIAETKPDVIVHLAAATDLDRAERNPEYAYELNAVGTHNVASAARAVGAKMVFASSTGIFNGKKETSYTKDDAPDPQNTYARSKLIAEHIVRDLVPEHLIVRGCWIFGGGPARDTKFVGATVAQLKNDVIHALDDVTGSPTYAKDFVAGIMEAIDADMRGIVHIGNAGICTRFDVSKHIVATLASSARVEAVQGDYFKLSANRLNNEALVSDITLRPWQDALTEYLTTEWPAV